MSLSRSRRTFNASTVNAGMVDTATDWQRLRACRLLRVYGFAALAILAAAGTGAANTGGAMPVTSPDPGWRRDDSAGIGRRREAARQLRLANSGDNPFFSFLEGLFGLNAPGERRRVRRPDRRPLPMPPPPIIAPPPEPPAVLPPEPVATYRSVCVRLCDGYYWPISFATTKDYLERDEATCASSCNSSAKLYYYSNAGGTVEEMTSLDGTPYKTLGTAFLYRTTYDANCKCNPHPWEAEAIARHQSFPRKTGGVRAVAQSPRK